MVPVPKPHARPRTQRGHLRVPVTPVGGAERLRGSTFLDSPRNPRTENERPRELFGFDRSAKSSL